MIIFAESIHENTRKIKTYNPCLINPYLPFIKKALQRFLFKKHCFVEISWVYFFLFKKNRNKKILHDVFNTTYIIFMSVKPKIFPTADSPQFLAIYICISLEWYCLKYEIVVRNCYCLRCFHCIKEYQLNFRKKMLLFILILREILTRWVTFIFLVFNNRGSKISWWVQIYNKQ